MGRGVDPGLAQDGSPLVCVARVIMSLSQNLPRRVRRANSPSGSRLDTNHRSSGKFFRFSYLRQVIDLPPQKIRKQILARERRFCDGLIMTRATNSVFSQL